MRARVFTLRLDGDRRALDDSELAAFLDEHDALSVAHHPLLVDGEPALAVVVTWRGERRREATVAVPRGRPLPPEKPLDLGDADRALYEVLRAWRNERARRDGRPAYVMFTNAQLAEVARLRPRSLAALREVPGIGEARASAFGEEVLAVVRGAEPGAGSVESGPRANHEAPGEPGSPAAGGALPDGGADVLASP